MPGQAAIAAGATFVAVALVAGLIAVLVARRIEGARSRLRALTAAPPATAQRRERRHWPQRAARRRRRIQNALPDALDLIVVCLEAGIGLNMALARAGDELGRVHPELAAELQLAAAETRAGSSRVVALRHVAERTGVADVRTLVGLLAQTERLGTSAASALRAHADTARGQRRLRAEERAARVGVQLVFPLILLLLPALYTVVLGPAVVQFVREFLSQAAVP